MSGTILQFEADNLRIDRNINADLMGLEFISEFYEWDDGRLVCIQYDTDQGDTDEIEDDLKTLCDWGVRGWVEMSAPDGGGQWKYTLTDAGLGEVGQTVVDVPELEDLRKCKEKLSELKIVLTRSGMYDEVKDIFEEVI